MYPVRHFHRLRGVRGDIMPIDDIIRAAIREAARAVKCPETRDGQIIMPQKEGSNDG